MATVKLSGVAVARCHEGDIRKSSRVARSAGAGSHPATRLASSVLAPEPDRLRWTLPSVHRGRDSDSQTTTWSMFATSKPIQPEANML
jgi:hypothetical protein